MKSLRSQFSALTVFLITLVWNPNSQARTASQESPTQQLTCRISLPYKVDQFPDCTPQSAAAYDLAFCAVANIAAAKFAPESDKLLGKDSKSKALMLKATTYLEISEALTDAATLKHNVESAKNFYSSLQKMDRANIQASLDYVKTKCSNIEAWHAKPVEELVQRLKAMSIETKTSAK